MQGLAVIMWSNRLQLPRNGTRMACCECSRQLTGTILRLFPSDQPNLICLTHIYGLVPQRSDADPVYLYLLNAVELSKVKNTDNKSRYLALGPPLSSAEGYRSPSMLGRESQLIILFGSHRQIGPRKETLWQTAQLGSG
jgi:hypothetical protein